MPKTLTTRFKQSTSRVDNFDFPIFIVEINHSVFEDTVRFCGNNKDITSNGNIYTAIGMKVQVPSDSDDSADLGATITIDNVGHTLVAALELTGGLAGAKITLGQILLSDLDSVVMQATFNLVNITMNVTNVTGTLTRPDIANAKSVFMTYTQETSPGLF